MRKLGTTIAPLATGLLVLAAVMPAAAAGPTGYASGAVTWTSPSGPPSRVSTFSVQDGRPGEHSLRGDSGWYRLSSGPNALTLANTLELEVSCVRVDASGWAEFAGVVTEATGVYVLGEVFLVSVKDGQPNGTVDEIGMKSQGTGSTALAAGCAAALDRYQSARKGSISLGDIAVRIN